MAKKLIETYTPEEFYFTLYERTSATEDEFHRLEGMYNRWKELIKYHARLYHPRGEKRLEKYTTLDIDRRASYIILGSMDLLTEFSAYYLTTFGDCRYGFIKYDLKEFAFQYDLDDKLRVDDILFLTSSAKEVYFGNTQRATYSNIIHTTCSRKCEGQITILLLEEPIPCFIESEEYKIIDLYKLFNRRKQVQVLPAFSDTQQQVEVSSDFNKFLQDNYTKIGGRIGELTEGTPTYYMVKSLYTKHKDNIEVFFTKLDAIIETMKVR